MLRPTLYVQLKNAKFFKYGVIPAAYKYVGESRHTSADCHFALSRDHEVTQLPCKVHSARAITRGTSQIYPGQVFKKADKWMLVEFPADMEKDLIQVIHPDVPVHLARLFVGIVAFVLTHDSFVAGLLAFGYPMPKLDPRNPQIPPPSSSDAPPTTHPSTPIGSPSSQ